MSRIKWREADTSFTRALRREYLRGQRSMFASYTIVLLSLTCSTLIILISKNII